MVVFSEEDKIRVSCAFDEWMRRYIEEPERYKRELQSVKEFIEEERKGVDHTYGNNCCGYLLWILKDMKEKQAASD